MNNTKLVLHLCYLVRLD